MRTLLTARADPDVREADGMGALHVACTRNQLGCLRLLIEAGADVELPTADRAKARPLHVAAGAHAYGVGISGVLALLDGGADPTAARADGQTAAALAPPGSRAHRALLGELGAWAARGGADEPRALTPRAALVHAVGRGDRRRLLELLQRHTDPDSLDEHGGVRAV